MKRPAIPKRGFTLIELMIVIAIIAILLTLALPAYRDYTIRSRVADGLSTAAAAKIAVLETCQVNPLAQVMQNGEAGYAFSATEYTADIQVRADCSAGLMAIRVQTQDTGASPDPVLVLATSFEATWTLTQNSLQSEPQGAVTWGCWTLEGLPVHVPSECRSIEQYAFGPAWYGQLSSYTAQLHGTNYRL